MTIESMTGFARASAQAGDDRIVWELKSVNGKGLDARLRLPPGFESIEQPARQALQKTFQRGNIYANLSVARLSAAPAAVTVNETLLVELATLAQRLEHDFGVAPARADGLLALRGVIEMQESILDDDARAARDAAILIVLDEALAGLTAARREEGRALKTIMLGQIDRIESLTERAAADPSRDPAAIRLRLAEQVRLLLETGAPLDETRLNAEAAYLATKADIREEIDRLRTHIASARTLLAGGGAVGRRLDFLSQEFNRESNTLCSKSNAAAITAIGLELKAVIDQFREQVQNLE
ncbi:YicC family protein [Mesorhizobium sp. YIM 152430]|uniref:YicC/YloC family endoribonuclease n=1 Tax=Mesorhizobium sp. YIM 152430 TaxID=3031761 RepID=UPI0023DA205B|nr:YicC/YloC family endoribonuclease [Mesorhizobium sp. YIM 152430]MDF1600458.1 YicC family protein [Mesorhizobium sp. YIM 152430]